MRLSRAGWLLKSYERLKKMETDKEYHGKAGEYLSSSLLKHYIKCPAYYKRVIDGEVERKDSDAFKFGRAAHCYILEGANAFNDNYVVGGGPINPKTEKPFGEQTKKYKEWLAEQTCDVVNDKMFDTILRMDEEIRKSEYYHIINDGEPEVVVRGEYLGRKCQIRMDILNNSVDQGIIADLKTCDDLDRFERDAARFGYFTQFAFYREIYKNECYGCIPHFFVFAIEKKEPFRCGVFKVSGETLDQVAETNKATILDLIESEKTGVFKTGYEELRFLERI